MAIDWEALNLIDWDWLIFILVMVIVALLTIDMVDRGPPHDRGKKED